MISLPWRSIASHTACFNCSLVAMPLPAPVPVPGLRAGHPRLSRRNSRTPQDRKNWMAGTSPANGILVGQATVDRRDKPGHVYLEGSDERLQSPADVCRADRAGDGAVRHGPAAGALAASI